jgi:uncharacterized protein (DUF58 family)
MHLTRPAIVLAILILALGILGQWDANLGALPWWRLLGGLMVIALAGEWLITRTRAVAARVAGNARFFLGREEQLALEFDNPGARRLALKFVAALPPAFEGPEDARTVVLAPVATSATELPVRSLSLGRHRLMPLPVRVRGPLGLAWWTRRLTLDGVLTVLPDTLGPKNLRSGSTRGGSNAESAVGGTMELHHLREYRSGDPLNTIDWKASARTSRLITRVFNEDQHLEVMILLDAGRTGRTQIDEIDQFGHYVNLAAKFAEYCVASDDRVGLVAFTDRPIAVLPPGRGMAAVQRLRRTLADLRPASIEADVLQAALHLRRMLRHRCLVVILTDLYERSATSQLVQASRLLLPKHLPLIVGLLSDDVLALSDRTARDWLDPYQSLAARQYRRDIAGNVGRLVQLGAQAMTARPQELDRKVLARYDLLRARRRI